MVEQLVIIDAVMEARAGFEQPFRQLLRDMEAASRKEPGCRTYRFTADLDVADRYHLLEIWAGEEALMAHLAGEALRTFIAGLGQYGVLLSSEPWIGHMEPCEIHLPAGDEA